MEELVDATGAMLRTRIHACVNLDDTFFLLYVKLSDRFSEFPESLSTAIGKASGKWVRVPKVKKGEKRYRTVTINGKAPKQPTMSFQKMLLAAFPEERRIRDAKHPAFLAYGKE